MEVVIASLCKMTTHCFSNLLQCCSVYSCLHMELYMMRKRSDEKTYAQHFPVQIRSRSVRPQTCTAPLCKGLRKFLKHGFFPKLGHEPANIWGSGSERTLSDDNCKETCRRDLKGNAHVRTAREPTQVGPCNCIYICGRYPRIYAVTQLI